ncbi:MAG: polynucleotide adenylyltransferase/metal dependent phosphohydrolase [Candidatus Berkelbacteria bacterium Licking1014_85]|uniref:Polynucleotide adenylyltransferase/metal dependent phosphohydrolase n=1 Tax=Candidatus Berkelbacteria bacterium Licking1014_85 TaxID=2017148 RepID=A0A554LMQ9_9BACT|nr:MAG: polynucleotide adenylyltransferase/metal dependent phosphohydrolase [Candidatus Berkelbacteria bacterium Licking1014_85]
MSVSAIPEKENLHTIWATLLHDIGKFEAITMSKNQNDRIRFNKHAYYSAASANTILNRLKFDRKFISSAMWLIEHHMSLYQILDMRPAKRQILFNNPLFPDLLKLTFYDALGTIPRSIDYIAEIQKIYQKEYKPISKSIITGRDLIEIGILPGKKIKYILDELWHLQLEGHIKNKKQGLEKAKELIDFFSKQE